jgi:hypothetical protein
MWLAIVLLVLVGLASAIVLAVDLCALGSFLLSFWREDKPSKPTRRNRHVGRTR